MIKILAMATCYNRKEKTLKAINNLISGNPGIKFRFIIADDNSTDGTGQALSMLPDVKVVFGDGNSYYTGGMRIAMAEALERLKNAQMPDYVMLFNDDVDFYDGAIEGLINKKDGYTAGRKNGAADGKDADKINGNTGSDMILVGPTCEADGVTFSYGGVKRKSNFKPKFWRIKAGNGRGYVNIADSGTDKLVEVDTFNANCVLIPTDLFIKTGNMDKVYNHSLGDFDYGYMLRRKGGRIYVSDEYVGICPFNSDEGTWNDTGLSRRERIKKKESIKGVPFGEFFHYLLKNYNILTAIIYSFSPYIRILIGK